jgi:DNA-binding beta-propeller fold protein YncE
MRITLVIPVLALALNGQTPGYLIGTVAGSGWIGDGGPATQAILRQPGGVAADASGNIYIAETDGNRVRKMDRSGAITTLAGTGVAGFSGDGGPAAQAQLSSPYGVAADILGNVLYRRPRECAGAARWVGRQHHDGRGGRHAGPESRE